MSNVTIYVCVVFKENQVTVFIHLFTVLTWKFCLHFISLALKDTSLTKPHRVRINQGKVTPVKMPESALKDTQDLLAVTQDDTGPENTSTQLSPTCSDGCVSQPIVNEVLCFLTNKIDVTPFSLLTKLCYDFYDESTLEAAKNVFFDAIAGNQSTQTSNKKLRKIKRRGNSKKQHDVEDIINALLETQPHSAPMFVARDLSQLPPIGLHNFDLCSLLKKVDDLNAKFALLEDVQRNTIEVISSKLTTVLDNAMNIPDHISTDSSQAINNDTEATNESNLQTPNSGSDTNTGSTDCGANVEPDYETQDDKDPHDDDASPETETKAESHYDESRDDTDDLLRLARIQRSTSASRERVHHKRSFADVARPSHVSNQQNSKFRQTNARHQPLKTATRINRNVRPDLITGKGQHFRIRAARTKNGQPQGR